MASTNRQQVETINVPLFETRATSTAGGGTALSTTTSTIAILKPAEWISVTPRNLGGGATVAQIALTPKLTIVQTTDNLSSVAGLTNLTEELQDGDVTDVDLGTAFGTGDDWIYIGGILPFRGARVTEGTTDNTEAVALDVEFWNGGSFVNVSTLVDGTSGAQSLDQTGNVTWDVPAGWQRGSLKNLVVDSVNTTATPFMGLNVYWVRWQWAGALTNSTDIRGLQALARSTAFMELLDGQTYEQKIPINRFGTVEAVTNAGTANLIINVGTGWGVEFD